MVPELSLQDIPSAAPAIMPGLFSSSPERDATQRKRSSLRVTCRGENLNTMATVCPENRASASFSSLYKRLKR